MSERVDVCPVIKYIGSKRVLVPTIVDAIGRASVVAREAGGGRGVQGSRELERSGASVIDLFSGTSRVGHALKRAGFRVLANDHNAYAWALARCYVEADADDVSREAEMLVRELNALAASDACEPGYFAETFCVQSRFFMPRNGARIDAVREAIAKKNLRPDLEAVMLVSLMEAADRVDSTTGLQMAYLKSWAPRASKELELRVPEVLPRASAGKGHATCLDAFDAVRALEGDVAYIDPPYNQHSYLGNYHVWESLVRWDKPEVYGVACKRVDVRERKSVFNSKREFASAMRRLIEGIKARVLVVSFNDEGYVTREEMEAILRGEGASGGEGERERTRECTLAHDDVASTESWRLGARDPRNPARSIVRASEPKLGTRGGLEAPRYTVMNNKARRGVVTIARDFKRYVGAQIGIYNPQGEKVGRVGKLRNTEFIFVACAGLSDGELAARMGIEEPKTTRTLARSA